MDKSAIKESFSKAAHSYDVYANIQKEAARDLARMTRWFCAPNSIFEIGCGTGLLSLNILDLYPSTPFMITDISHDMIRECRKKIDSPNASFMLADGESINFTSHYDWIISNFCFQWFSNLEQTLPYLSLHCNELIFTMLLQGSFQEWDCLCASHSIPSGLIKLPTAASLEAIFRNIPTSNFQLLIETKREIFPSPFAFLRALKKIGATQPRDGYKSSLIPKSLAANTEPFVADYVIAYCFISKREI